MNSVKTNFVWSTILTVAGYVFPFITFPYVTRVLGVENIGSTNFSSSVISYFCVFAMMGMSLVGVREIAKVNKSDRSELSKVFGSLFALNIITTFIAVVVLLILIQIVPSFKSHSILLYIGIGQLLCGSLLIEWLYKGLEDFRYVTMRSIAIRCLYVIAVFVFVRKQNDYILYFALTTLLTVINSFINLFHARKYIKFQLDFSYVKEYIKPYVIFGVYMILTNMYGSFNTIFLGVNCGDIEVGYYTTATKLYVIIISVFTSFTSVMMPRMSSLIADGKEKEFKDMTSKSVDFLFLFCFPLIIIIEVFSPQIIQIIAGPGYEGSILPIRLLMPLILIVGYEQIIVIQMLMPLGKDNVILINSGIGAIVSLILNIVLVPVLASVGSSIVWLCCELAVAFSSQYFVKKYIGYCIPLRKISRAIIVYIPAFFICLAIHHYIQPTIAAMAMSFFVVGVYALTIEVFAIKNQIAIDCIKIIEKRLFKH